MIKTREEGMKIGGTLKVIRKNKKLSQQDLSTTYMDRTAFSRVERDERSIRVRDLLDILNILSVDLNEFFSLSKESNDLFRELFYYCSDNLDDQKSKKRLLAYYKTNNEKTEKNLKELSNHLAIKNCFCQHWEEVPSIEKEEIQDVVKLLKEKKYYYQYDYVILLNTIAYFEKADADFIFKKSFPLSDESRRDYTTKNAAYNALLNLINIRIYDGDLKLAKKYLTFAKKQGNFKRNYSYKLELNYFENIIDFLSTGKVDSYNRILTFIDIYDYMGDHERSKQMRTEMEMLTKNHFIETFIDGKPQFPIGIIKEG